MVSQGDRPTDGQPDPHIQGRVLAVQRGGQLGRVSRHLPMMVTHLLDWLCYYRRRVRRLTGVVISAEAAPVSTVDKCSDGSGAV